MDIKICGIRRAADVDIMNEFMPDYVGFVFANSRRQVTAAEAAEISALLNPEIKTVGVFVNASVEDAAKTAKTAGLDVIQLHGDEDEDYIRDLRRAFKNPPEIWKAVRVKGGDTVRDIRGADRILLDKYSGGAYGGTGETFDWLGGVKIETDTPIMLAGGLNADNVLDGIRIFAPAGVDVSSAVETDGFKDREKVRNFIKKVRDNEQNR